MPYTEKMGTHMENQPHGNPKQPTAAINLAKTKGSTLSTRKTVDRKYPRLRYIIARQVLKGRKQLGLNQYELSRQIGVRPSVLCKIEKGEQIPELPTLILLAEVFGTDINYFLEDYLKK